jgi:hypothetical protein
MQTATYYSIPKSPTRQINFALLTLHLVLRPLVKLFQNLSSRIWICGNSLSKHEAELFPTEKVMHLVCVSGLYLVCQRSQLMLLQNGHKWSSEHTFFFMQGDVHDVNQFCSLVWLKKPTKREFEAESFFCILLSSVPTASHIHSLFLCFRKLTQLLVAKTLVTQSNNTTHNSIIIHHH